MHARLKPKRETFGERRRWRAALAEGFEGGTHDAQAIATPELLRYVSAGAGAVSFDGVLHRVGAAPADGALEALIEWLERGGRSVFESRRLGDEYPPSLAWGFPAAGLLAIGVPHAWVLWFRTDLDQDRRSAPWSDADVEAAEALRAVLLEAVLTRTLSAHAQQERQFQHQSILLADLDHRFKNALARIQSLVHLSSAGAPSAAALAASLDARIKSMARAHSLLAAERWSGASLRKMLLEETAMLSTDGAPRVLLRGKEVMLDPLDALALSMVLHELVTNALKYGALSVPSGTVTVSWKWSGRPQHLDIEWSEVGGPPLDRAPAAGFGMTIIERTVEYELRGSVKFTHEAAGLECRLALPLTPVPRP